MDQNNDELIRKASKRKKDNIGEIQSKHLKKEVKNLKTIKCSLNTFIKSNKQVLLEEIKNNVNILSDLLIKFCNRTEMLKLNMKIIEIILWSSSIIFKKDRKLNISSMSIITIFEQNMDYNCMICLTSLNL